jgi:hypothetical protein
MRIGMCASNLNKHQNSWNHSKYYTWFNKTNIGITNFKIVLECLCMFGSKEILNEPCIKKVMTK